MLSVQTVDGEQLMARPLARAGQAVCGDEVECEFDTLHQELRVVALSPRSSALYRSNARGQAEPVAANLTKLAIVVAPLPQPDFFIVDRYLAAAQCAGIPAVVLLNKSELTTDAGISLELSNYQRLGLTVLHLSAATGSGLAALKALLQGQTAALVGQSGVGKSSLLRALVPDSQAGIGALIRHDEGRHTTTATRFYALPGGGALLDSPGVRDFAPALERLHDAALGFSEVESLSPGCRFGDCRHLREPDCAVRAALGGQISERRYESYRRLRRLCERLRHAPGSRGNPRGQLKE